ncbi:hypothetical protein ACIGXA_16420 [Streptomyces fildesensis]|uniref:Integral membrane protein n=1 Tax=Streptomyces fildesensis TaxID=375757 RepID=A0ABW8C6Q2_9ACTN
MNARLVRAASGAVAGTPTAFTGLGHGTAGLVVTAVVVIVTSTVAVVVPEVFWWQALNPLRPLRWYARHGRLDGAHGAELIRAADAGHARVVRARKER